MGGPFILLPVPDVVLEGVLLDYMLKDMPPDEYINAIFIIWNVWCGIVKNLNPLFVGAYI